MFLKTILFLIISFSSISLSAADLNATLIEAKSKTFESLLQKIPAEGNLSAEQALEKTLLKKLISQKPVLHEESLPPQLNTEERYRKAFLQYLRNVREISELRAKREQNHLKILQIEKRIHQLDNQAPDLLSLQLEDAFYHRNEHFYREEIVRKKRFQEKLSKRFIEDLPLVVFTPQQIKEQLQTYLVFAKKYKDAITQLKINQDQLILEGEKPEVAQLAEKIKNVKHAYLYILDDILTERFLLFFYNLQKKKIDAFQIEKKMRSQLMEMSRLSSLDLYTSVVPLFLKMENRYLGHIITLTDASKQELESLMQKVWSELNKPIISVGDAHISPFKMLMTLLVFVLGVLLAGFYKKKINRLTLNQDSFTTSTRMIVANLGYYLIILLAFFAALNVLGIKLSSLALVAGALSVGIGFGLQNIVSNFVSGLILMFEKSIKIGDYVQLTESGLRGHVTDIRMRSTTINTNENIDIIVPNQVFIQHNVINWTMNDKVRRFEIPFGVKYGTDAEKVIEIILKAVEESEYGDIYHSGNRRTKVIMTGMGDSSVNFSLLVWLKGNAIFYPKQTASRFLVLIYKALNENGIEIPFPQRDLHIRSVEVPIPVIVTSEEKNDAPSKEQR